MAPAAATRASVPVRRRRVRGESLCLGILGGTFDPPHIGHLVIAECAREQLALDRVLFVPAGMPPHKRAHTRSTAATRLAMTRLAVRGNPAFEVSSLETRRRGPSFTIDTVRALRRRDPTAQLFLIIGADSLDEFHTWREPDAIAAEVTIAVAMRPAAERAVRRAGPAIVCLDNPRFEVSSSMIRARARAGQSLRYLVPDAVARYIERRRLYRSGS